MGTLQVRLWLQNEEMMRIQQVSKEIYFSRLEAKAIQGG